MTKMPVMTLGPLWASWIEQNCRFSAGDLVGKPAKLRDEQRQILLRLGALEADGSPKYLSYHILRARGYGKTQLLGWLAALFFAGPTVFTGWQNKIPQAQAHVSPEVLITATTMEQARRLFEATAFQFRSGPLAPLAKLKQAEILFQGDKTGFIKRLAAEKRSTDSYNATLYVCDEGQEFTGSLKESFTKLQEATLKREPPGRVLVIGTAGTKHADSILEESYTQALAEESGKPSIPRQKIDLVRASEQWDLSDPRQLKSAVREAQPWLSDAGIDVRCAMFQTGQLNEVAFRTRQLNQFTEGLSVNWLAGAPGAWSKCYDPSTHLDTKTPTVLALDFGFSRDTTAAVWAQKTAKGQYVVRSKIWTPGPGGSSKTLASDVEKFVFHLCKSHNIIGIAFDPRGFEFTANSWAEQGLPMMPFAQQQSKLEPATLHAYQLITRRQISHDGDKLLKTHVHSAVARYSPRGFSLEKRGAKQHVDGAIALVMALFSIDSWAAELAARPQPGIASSAKAPELEAARQEIKQRRLEASEALKGST